MQKNFKRVISMAAALAMSFSFITGAGFTGTAESVSYDYSEDRLVPVIVTVNGGAVLENAPYDAKEYLKTGEAAASSANAVSLQKQVQDYIRGYYPELEVGYSYSILLNGFSCELPESLIDVIKDYPLISNVSENEELHVPDMNEAASLGKINKFCNDTGFTGEGQVIAVIDTELDITNDMFAPIDDKNVALTKEDIAEVAGGIGLCVDIDPERAYVSSKLPYVIDYSDDPYEGIADSNGYHGTHVAGIAAGNEVTTEDGSVISGAAKDAQIIFMACGISGTTAFNQAAAAAALEDAVKLGADVINLSFGTDAAELFDGEEAPIALMMEAAENAGVIICQSAGNAGNASFNRPIPNVVSNPDTSMTGRDGGGKNTMIVASADNNYDMKYHVFIHDGISVKYTEYMSEQEMKQMGYLNDYFKEPSYEYEYCGMGYAEDFEGKDLTGKIALVDRGILKFTEKAENAASAGALGILIIDHKDSIPSTVYSDTIPAAMISREDGELLIESENKTISFSDELLTEHLSTAVSDFTSWGTMESLELIPDIMGIGGNVLSAGYDNTHPCMSGTSMSSPYVAGCAALVKQYASSLKPELSESELASFICNMMMNTAVPYSENGVYVQPRRQGAGLVQLDRVLTDKVQVTDNNGRAKVSLYDQLNDTFSFDLCLENFSNEDVAFSGAKIVLTTEGYKFDEELNDNVIDGQIVLESSCDLSGLMNIAAGEKRAEKVTVSLNPAQLASIGEIFCNGFFVEGYIILEGADNCSDISVPVLGFRGDWTAAPVFDMSGELGTALGNSGVSTGRPVIQLTELIRDIFSNIPAEELDAAASFDEVTELIFKYGTEEQLARIENFEPGETVISPNGDGLGDNIGKVGISLRSAYCYGADIYDETGKLVVKGFEQKIPKGMTVTCQPEKTLDSLPDGKYTGVVRSKINYNRTENNIQTDSFEFYIDNKKPDVVTEIKEENGHTYLTLKATDENLDGIFVIGNGEARKTGSDSSDSGDARYAVNYALTALKNNGAYLSGEFSGYNTIIRKILSYTAVEEEMFSYDFSDIVVPEKDEKSITVEYDVTGLTDYTFAVLDKAYNIYEYEGGVEPAESIKDGIWTSDQGIVYAFEKGNFTAVSRNDGSKINGKVTLENGNAVFSFGTENEQDSAFITVKDESLVIKWEDGSKEIITFSREGKAEDIKIKNASGYIDDIIAKYRAFYVVALGESFEPTRYEILTGDTEDAVIIIYCNMNGMETMSMYYNVNIETGEATDATGAQMQFEYKEPSDDVSETPEPSVTEEPAVTPAVTEKEPEVTTTENKPETTTGSSASEKRYSDKELCDMALKDYEQKNGVRPSDAKVIDNGDGTVSVVLGDLDVYTVDPATGKGTDSAGKAVDLPQTGVTSPAAAITVFGAASMIAAGTFMLSRNRRRKEEK